jgi:hypothetical protein
MTDIDILSRGRDAGQDTDTPLRGVRCPPVPTGIFTIGVILFSLPGLGPLAVWPCLTAHRRRSAVAFGAAPRATLGHRSDGPCIRKSGDDAPTTLADVPPQQVVPCSRRRGVKRAIVRAKLAKIINEVTQTAKPTPETMDIAYVAQVAAEIARAG